jgi:hypothetical protein
MTAHLTEGHKKAQKAQNHSEVPLWFLCLFVACYTSRHAEEKASG